MAATIIAKNLTASALSLSQIPVPDNEIPASGQVTLTDFATVAEIQEDQDLEGYVNGGQVILNDGIADLTQQQSLNYLTTVVARNGIDGNVTQNNYAATVDPGTGDDDTQGYAVGSEWVNTTSDEVFRCVDATTGSAVWVSLSSSSSGSIPTLGSSTDNAIATWDGTGGTTLQDTSVIIDASGNVSGVGDLTLTGTVDGRDVSSDGTTLDSHVANTSNPHSTSIANLGSGTLAQLNSSVSDATLDDAGDPRDPLAHASTHGNGGSDEISVAGLSGVLADPQTPSAHASTHENGGSDEISVAGLSGVLADPQTPSAHANTHERGGSDEIDGDILDIDYVPANYTRDTAPSQVSNAQHLTAHLAGIDTAIINANDPDAIHDNVSAEIDAVTAKTDLSGSDLLLLEDSGDSFSKKKAQLSDLPLKVVAYGASEGVSTRTQSSYGQKLRLSFTSKNKDYLIFYTCELEPAKNRVAGGRVQLDDSTTLAEVEVPKDLNYASFSGFRRLTLASGSHDVDIDFRSGQNGKSVSIRRARVAVLETI